MVVRLIAISVQVISHLADGLRVSFLTKIAAERTIGETEARTRNAERTTQCRLSRSFLCAVQIAAALAPRPPITGAQASAMLFQINVNKAWQSARLACGTRT